jgi:hypothetical protein
MLIIETHEGTGLILDNNEALVKEMLGKFDRDSLVNIFDENGKHIEILKINELFSYETVI